MSKTTSIESLPDDLVSNILLRLPAQEIYEAARFVCPKWFLLTRTHDFIRAHLHQSTHGLLIQEIGPELDRPILVGARNGRLEISNFENYKFKGKVMSSCNGLILEAGDGLHLTNPVTKQHFALPAINTTIFQSPAIAYAAATKEYKVVYADISSNSTPDGIAILTVGVDKDWTRRVDIQHLSLTDKGLLRQRSLATQGFVHWVEEENVLTLNVEKETITRSRVPCEGERLWYYYLSMGSHLSVLIRCAALSWEVWEMEPETGEWASKVTRVDLEAQKSVLEFKIWRGQITPVGWSKFGDVLVFSSVPDPKAHILHALFAFAYNVGTHEIESFELDWGFKNFIAHGNSLVWLN